MKYIFLLVLEQRRNKNLLQFITLKKKNMTIAQYKANFNEPSKFCPNAVDDEETQAYKFQIGLRAEISKGVAPLQLTT